MKTQLKLATAFAILALAPSASAATMSASSTAPVINDADIANYGDVSGTDKWFMNSTADNGARGQSFTTGGAAVRLKAITYQVSEGNGAAPTKTYAVRVGKITGTNFTQVHSETATQSFSWTGGQYMTWTFSTPVLLEPYTTYGIDVGMTSSTSAWQTGIPYINITGDEYAGGTSYTAGASTVAIAIASDRTFHLDIERPLDSVFSLVAPSPADNATDSYASRELVMTFSQNVTPGTGSLTIRNLTDNSDTLLPANDPRLTYDQNVVRINPAGLIDWNKNYAIRIDAGFFLGDASAPITAITDDTTWNFTTIAADPLLSALAAIKAHVLNTTPLTGPQISAHKTTIDNNRQRFAENTNIINAVFDLISTYDTAKGPLFVSGFANNATSFDRNVTTGTAKNSVSPENYHWVIYTVMQHAMDLIYTAENLAKYEATLANYKFGSHSSFPGPCSPPANPANTHTVSINGSFPVTFGRNTQMWTVAARKPTGTYLAPGTIATVTVPPALVNAGYKVRVGAHAWDLSGRRPVNRLERATRLFPLDATTIKIASPYGGGIYIEVPIGASAGVVNVTVTGGVRAPYFSAKTFHQTTPTEWTTERTHPAPWADFQSEKFMFQVPRKWIYNMTGTQATQLMVDWDKAMDAINDLMGFDRNRGKETMYCQTDVILRSSVHAPGYPAVNVTSNVNSEVSPAGYAGNYLVRGPATTLTAANIEFHEQGHAYGFPKFGGESESNVNLLQPAMLYRAFGKTIDEAQNGSFGGGNSFITVDTTAIAWMCVFSFSPNEIPMQQLEKQYQHKGHAKWMDIARIYATGPNPNAGWEKLDAYWRSFMLDDAANISYGTGTDDLLLRLSRHVGKDIRPLFHFWGIHPQNPSALAAALAAENLTPDPAIKAKLLHYKSIVPADNAAFRSFCMSWWGRKPTVAGAWEETDHAMQWDTALDADGTNNPNVRPTITTGSMYVEGCAAEIRARVDELVDLYFPTGITPGTMTFAIAPAVVNPATVGMVATTATAAVGPMEYFFDETSGNTGGTDSGWQTSPVYQDLGLTTGLTYTYVVTARDALGNLSNPSAASAATPTVAGDNLPPTPSPMTFAVAPVALGETSISMTASTAVDINGVEYYFDCISPGGHDSGWQDSPTYIDTALPTGVSYTYQVQARDKSTAQNPTAFSAAASATTSDVTPPALASLDPANGSPGVPGTSDLAVTFNEPIAPGTGFITLKNLTDTTQTQINITDGSQASILGPVLTINPAADLLEGKTYAIQINATAIDDLPGNSFPGITNDTTWFFTTLDPTPPDIASLSPADDTTNAPYNANLVVTFDETVVIGTGNITIKNLTDATQTTIAITDATQVSASGAVLTINPSADLIALKDYAVQIEAGAITDAASNPFPGINDDTTWNFTTDVVPYVWTRTTGGAQSWNTSANWQDGIVPSPVAGDTVDFSSANITAATTLTLEADRIAKVWKFGDAVTASHDWTVNAGNSMILAGTTPTIEVVNRTATLNNIVAGTSGLTKSGAGTLALAGANTYSGGTTITGGILSVTSTATASVAGGPLSLSGGGRLTVSSTNISSANQVSVGTGGGLISVNGNNNFTTTGKLTGSGTLTHADPGGGGGRSLNFNDTSNDFTGGIIIGGGSGLTFAVNSLADSANNIAFTAASGSNGFTYGSGATSALTLNSRAFEINSAGALTSTITNNSTTRALTINTGLVATGAGNKQLTLSAASGPTNVFAGDITNGTGGGTVALLHTSGVWELRGNNSYSGDTLVNVALTMRGTAAVSPNTKFRMGGTDGSAGNNDTIQIFTNDAGTVNLGNQLDLRTVQTSAAASWGVNIGNNGGATTGSTIVLGKVNFNYITDYRAAGATLNATGANGYRLQVSDVDLNWGQNGAQGFNPTTAPLTITGTVRQVSGRPATGTSVGNVTLGSAAQTLSLGGTALGNLISGAVTDALDYPSNTNALPLNVSKKETGDWTLGGAANSFTGSITLNSTTSSSGTLAYASAAGTNPITFLQTTGSATLKYTGAAPLTMSGLITASALTTGTITLDASGVTAADTVNYSNPSSLSVVSTSTSARNIVLTGSNAGSNIFNGAITNNSGTGGTATLTKNGTGTWVLTGSNTHTGATNVTAGKILINGSTAASAVTVSANATLGGTGLIGGNTTIAADGKLEFDLSTPAAGHDKLDLAATKSLSFSGASVLTITSNGGAGPGDYTLVTAPGGFGSSVVPATVNLPSGWTADAPRFVSTDLKMNITSTGSGNTYATWIGIYPGAAAMPGFDQDADGDGIKNGIENFFGTNPSVFSSGLIAGTKSGNTFTFTHPQNATPGSDVSAVYRWSKDLSVFNASGAADGAGTTVAFTTQLNTPSPGITTVTATVTGTATANLFVDVKVTQN